METRWGSEPRTSSTSAGRRRLIQHLARLRRLVQQLRRRPKLDRLDQPGVWMPRNRADAARRRHGAAGAGGPLSAKASLRGSDTRERLKDFRSVPNTVVSRVAQGRRRGASAGFSAGGFLAAQGKPSGSKGRHRASGLPNGRPPPGGDASPGARPSSHSLATVSSASGNSSVLSIRSFATTLQAGRVARVSVAWQSGRLAQAMPEDYRESSAAAARSRSIRAPAMPSRTAVERLKAHAGGRPGLLSSSDREELAELPREVREPRKANEILKAARCFSPRSSTRPDPK